MKRLAGVFVALAAVGAVVAFAAGDSTAATAVAIALIGCAGVGAVSLAFFAIGEAEDRDREEATHRRPPAPEDPPAAEADPHPRTLGLGPDRRRGRPPRRPG